MKDILKYFIDYCKDSDGVFSVEKMDRFLDKGFVITNSNNEFKLPSKNLYILCDGNTFINRVYNNVSPGEYWPYLITERTIDNGFEKNLDRLQTILSPSDYQQLEEGALVEVVDGESIFIKYPRLFTKINDIFLLIQKGVVIFYDERYNNIIISSVETFSNQNKYLNFTQPEILPGFKYSVFGELILP